jgi:predicted RNA-binding Zn-ribbon protein involved in translation (DUF1610 family)
VLNACSVPLQLLGVHPPTHPPAHLPTHPPTRLPTSHQRTSLRCTQRDDDVLLAQLWTCPECGDRVEVGDKIAHAQRHGASQTCDACGDTVDAGGIKAHAVRVVTNIVFPRQPDVILAHTHFQTNSLVPSSEYLCTTHMVSCHSKRAPWSQRGNHPVCIHTLRSLQRAAIATPSVAVAPFCPLTAVALTLSPFALSLLLR